MLCAVKHEIGSQKALSKLEAVFHSLKLDDLLNHVVKFNFSGHYFESRCASAQFRLSENADRLIECLQKMSTIEVEMIANHLRKVFQSDAHSLDDKFNLYEILLQSTEAFSMAVRIQDFIYNPAYFFAAEAQNSQLKNKVKRLLEDKTNWHIQASNAERLTSLRKQSSLISDYRYAVLEYRKMIGEFFCRDDIYRQVEGKYSLHNMTLFLEHGQYIPEDHLDAFFKYSQIFILLDIGEDFELTGQMEQTFSFFYNLLSTDDKKILHKSTISKIEAYINDLGAPEKASLKLSFLNPDCSAQYMSFLSLLETVAAMPEKEEQESSKENLFEKANCFTPAMGTSTFGSANPTPFERNAQESLSGSSQGWKKRSGSFI